MSDLGVKHVRPVGLPDVGQLAGGFEQLLMVGEQRALDINVLLGRQDLEVFDPHAVDDPQPLGFDLHAHW